MFDILSSRFENIFKKLRGQGFISEKDIDDTLREIRLALLEADVNYKVVKDFTSKIKEEVAKTELAKSLTPAQQVIKVVYNELVRLLGETPQKISFSSKPPTIFMLIGLQGSGKTSAAAKLAYSLKKQNKKTLVVALDIYRP
ncbi:MAG: signal recognition particle receptor subunit alpha, partial [Candidatus Subteraquimicrobiales bacterium]|nr:signal recognition particle receptor subunit alpha [Candidatus Subteraquimicrobiales bacterium]